jgi:hypothetical protein
MDARRRVGAVATLVPAVLLATACGITVQEDEDNGSADVDIQTPLGDLSVRANSEGADTGLAVHPGARPQRHGRRRGPTNANVRIDSPLFDLRVAAAEYEDDAPPSEIIEFYKKEMAAYGDVVECRGNLDFTGRRVRPVCHERRGSREVSLVVGTERQHRIVAVEPRGTGSEFAVVYVRTDD